MPYHVKLSKTHLWGDIICSGTEGRPERSVVFHKHKARSRFIYFLSLSLENVNMMKDIIIYMMLLLTSNQKIIHKFYEFTRKK